VGAHVVAPNAGDFIGEAVLAIKFGLRVQEVVSTLHPYLTWGEGLKLAGQTFTKDVAKLFLLRIGNFAAAVAWTPLDLFGLDGRVVGGSIYPHLEIFHAQRDEPLLIFLSHPR
jgi:hypothetical protein